MRRCKEVVPEVRLKKIGLAKGANSFNDTISNLVERINNPFSLNNPDFAKRCIKMECHVLLHFGLRDREEYVALFERDAGCFGTNEHRSLQMRNRVTRITSPKFADDICPLAGQQTVGKMCRTNRNQQAMLVDVIKVMESPERIIPTFVWFDRVDSF
jgi:hypothetical protein